MTCLGWSQQPVTNTSTDGSAAPPRPPCPLQLPTSGNLKFTFKSAKPGVYVVGASPALPTCAASPRATHTVSQPWCASTLASHLVCHHCADLAAACCRARAHRISSVQPQVTAQVSAHALTEPRVICCSILTHAPLPSAHPHPRRMCPSQTRSLRSCGRRRCACIPMHMRSLCCQGWLAAHVLCSPCACTVRRRRAVPPHALLD